MPMTATPVKVFLNTVTQKMSDSFKKVVYIVKNDNYDQLCEKSNHLLVSQTVCDSQLEHKKSGGTEPMKLIRFMRSTTLLLTITMVSAC
jgi:hypothetical protein